MAKRAATTNQVPFEANTAPKSVQSFLLLQQHKFPDGAEYRLQQWKPPSQLLRNTNTEQPAIEELLVDFRNCELRAATSGPVVIRGLIESALEVQPDPVALLFLGHLLRRGHVIPTNLGLAQTLFDRAEALGLPKNPNLEASIQKIPPPLAFSGGIITNDQLATMMECVSVLIPTLGITVASIKAVRTFIASFAESFSRSNSIPAQYGEDFILSTIEHRIASHLLYRASTSAVINFRDPDEIQQLQDAAKSSARRRVGLSAKVEVTTEEKARRRKPDGPAASSRKRGKRS